MYLDTSVAGKGVKGVRGSILAAILLAILNILDAVFTAKGISEFGIEIEVNPIMRNLIQEYGIWCLYAFKAFFVGLLLVMLWKTPEEKLRRIVTPSLWALVGAYSVIVFYGAMIWTVI